MSKTFKNKKQQKIKNIMLRTKRRIKKISRTEETLLKELQSIIKEIETYIF